MISGADGWRQFCWYETLCFHFSNNALLTNQTNITIINLNSEITVIRMHGWNWCTAWVTQTTTNEMVEDTLTIWISQWASEFRLKLFKHVTTTKTKLLLLYTLFHLFAVFVVRGVGAEPLVVTPLYVDMYLQHERWCCQRGNQFVIGFASAPIGIYTLSRLFVCR